MLINVTLTPIIPLGEKFDASMVAKVLSKQEHSYKAQGSTKLKGQLLRIEPVKPDDRFQQYSLKTTDEGIIYAIRTITSIKLSRIKLCLMKPNLMRANQKVAVRVRENLATGNRPMLCNRPVRPQ